MNALEAAVTALTAEVALDQTALQNFSASNPTPAQLASMTTAINQAVSQLAAMRASITAPAASS